MSSSHKLLQFTNPGSLDPRVFQVFGLSAKTTDTPIGKFGTGLKYAIAGILRLGGRIKIQNGSFLYDFDKNPDSIRGKDFYFCRFRGDHINPDGLYNTDWQTLPFTTELGQHWEPWMLYRELWSNCMDEGGTVAIVQPGLNQAEGQQVVIEVDCPELIAVHYAPETFLAQGPQVWTNNRTLEIQEQTGTRNFALKGLRVGKSSYPCLFTYNLLEPIELTEDRTVANVWRQDQIIVTAVAKAKNEDFLKKFLFAPPGYYENYLDFYGTSPSKEFVAVALAALRDKALQNNSIQRLLKSELGEEVVQKILDEVPEDWEKVVAEAPAIPEEDAHFWDFQSQILDLITERNSAVNAARYWRNVAFYLKGALPEALPEALPDVLF